MFLLKVLLVIYSRRSLMLALLFSLFSLLAGNASDALAAGPSVSPLNPAHLRCDYQTDPLGIDDLHPSVSWLSLSRTPEVRGQSQSAYQVQAASSAQGLARGDADLWDTHKVASDLSVELPYAGRPLRSNAQCFWRVRVWDQDGRPSPWSLAARWTMGILSSSEWQAKWIAAASPQVRWHDFTLETSFTIPHEAASVYFRADGP